MRALHRSAFPAGFAHEPSAVAYATPRSLTVARNAATDYQEGTPVLLMQDGGFTYASVVGVSHNASDGKTYLVLSEKVSPSIYGLLRNALASHAYGNSIQTGVLYHFESNALGAILYDAALNSANHSTDATKMTLVGTAPTLTTSQAKFGSRSLLCAAGGCYRNPAWNASLFGLTFLSDWTVEVYVYGIPVGTSCLLCGFSRLGSGGQWGTSLYFSNGQPAMQALHQDSGYSALVQSHVACSPGQWNHAVWDYSYINQVVNIFVNGALTATGSMIARNGQINSFLGDIRFDNGPTVFYSSNYFNGILDEFRFHKVCGIYRNGYTIPSKPFGPDPR
ncbi:Concanavalin A-like lectin/glucanases superfamily protein [anaerobic digester metagenome]